MWVLIFAALILIILFAYNAGKKDAKSGHSFTGSSPTMNVPHVQEPSYSNNNPVDKANKELIDSAATYISFIITGIFSAEVFDQLFSSKKFPDGWDREDALSRWYSLGIICLHRCLTSRQWNAALPINLGVPVHDAALESMWVEWKMPDQTRAKVNRYMQSNIKNVTRSFNTVTNKSTRVLWFRRYTERLFGMNPSWDMTDGDRSLADDPLKKDDKLAPYGGDAWISGNGSQTFIYETLSLVFTDAVNKIGEELMAARGRL